MRALVAIVASAVLLVGCIDDFDPPSLVTKNRPLGVRVEIDGAADRAWPAAEENVTLTWLMADAGEPRPLTWGLLACPGIVAPTGDTFCVAAPSGFTRQETPTETEAPSIAFTMPTAAALAGVDRILVQGMVCADGVIRVDSTMLDASCEGDGAVASRVSAAVRIATATAEANRHPTLQADAITFDGQPWTTPPTGVPLTGCAAMAGGSALPSVGQTDTDPEVVVQGTPGDRETITGVDGSMTREALVFAHYSTGGELARQFSVIDDDNPEVRVDWTAPDAADVASDGQRVRFYFVVRDGRGGLAWTIRELCAVL